MSWICFGSCSQNTMNNIFEFLLKEVKITIAIDGSNIK